MSTKTQQMAATPKTDLAEGFISSEGLVGQSTPAYAAMSGFARGMEESMTELVDRLERRNSGLKAELARIGGVNTETEGCCDAYIAQVDGLRRENTGLKEDRDRIDWFEKHVSAVSMRTVFFSFPGDRTLREAISEAMKEPYIK